MTMGEISTVLMLLASIGLASGPARDVEARNDALQDVFLLQTSTAVQASETPETLHGKCARAAEQTNRQAEEMVPGRTWTWALDAERSLQQLDGLRGDLTALRECEAAFEADLARNQLATYAAEIRAMHQLSQHLERDVQNLDDELRKGHPRRWHVAHDAEDMHKEIQRWQRLHETVWAGLRAK
jgi:hypothetical protein